MINALHLLWIVPLAAGLGSFALAVFIGGDCDPDWFDDEQRYRDTV